MAGIILQKHFSKFAPVDIFGEALKDYYHNNNEHKLWLYNSYGEPEEMPVEVFFRDEADMPEFELLALAECRGSILDIGAGSGCHSLLLQELKNDVTALELSPSACTIMAERGIQNIINQDIFSFSPIKSYDTLLMLMNGIGVCGNYATLPSYLLHLKSMLKPDGKIIFDSSDISYLYDGTERHSGKEQGEVSYCYEYKKNKGAWFDWLYVAPQHMEQFASQAGLSFNLVYQDEQDQYLAILTQK